MCGSGRPAAVIKMEGGTDHDLRILDLPTEEEEEREKAAAMSAAGDASKREEHKTQEAERKPSAEKDKNEKVKFELGLCSCTVQSQLYTHSKPFHRRRATLSQRETPQLPERMGRRRQRKRTARKKHLSPRK